MRPFVRHPVAVVQDAMASIRRSVEEGVAAAPLELLAADAGVSVRTLQRHFRHVLGKPLRGVVAEIRLQRAVLLVQTTHLPLADIAAAVGLGSQSRMNELFRRLLGDSPGGFRDRGESTSVARGNNTASDRM